MRWLTLLFLLSTSCGGDGNVADCDDGIKGIPCSERTADEEARLALDREDFATAVTLLTDLVGKEPEGYERYTLLAAALAGQAGLDIFALAKGQLGGDGTILSLVNQFLPDPSKLSEAEYDDSIRLMDAAVNRLLAIPSALRSETSSARYAASARFQLTLYQTSF